MKIAILTTDTSPHRYFCREVAQVAEVGGFLEAEPAEPPGFESPVTVLQVEHEAKTWGRHALDDILWQGESLNTGFAGHEIRAYNPDLILVNGTLKLGAPVLAVCPNAIVNFHSGDPRHYRGLHCDLWTIWHKDWNNLGVCAHLCAAELDSGAILDAECIVSPDALHGLRIKKANAAVRLARRIIERFERNRVVEETYSPGRYYSAMPKVLQYKVDTILRERAVR